MLIPSASEGETIRALLEELGGQLKAFVGQREDLALVLESRSTETLPILTVIEGLEADADGELFWIHCEPFGAAADYAAALVRTFAAKHQAVRLMQEKAGMAPWPSIPQSTLSDATPPARRIQQLAAFSRELLPGPGQRSVWVLHPVEIADPPAFNGLLRDVLRHQFPDPWCHDIRFILRSEPDDPSLELLTTAPRVRALRPDLGADAVRRSLEASLDDRSVPLDERIGNLLIMAAADQAMHQHEAALSKYEIIREHHVATGNSALAAVASNGMGEALEKLGQLVPAAEHYEQAVILAGQGPHPAVAVLLNAVTNLARVRQMEARWAEAAAWWDMAQQLAVVARNASARVQAMECLGICQFHLGARDDAERTLVDASVIAAALEDLTACRGIVLRLCQYYQSIGARDKERERREQLAALGHEGAV